MKYKYCWNCDNLDSNQYGCYCMILHPEPIIENGICNCFIANKKGWIKIMNEIKFKVVYKENGETKETVDWGRNREHVVDLIKDTEEDIEIVSVDFADDNEKEIAVLMEDRCTRKEAERYLKDGTVVYESFEDWIDNLGDLIKEILEEYNVDIDGYKQLAREGGLADTSVVMFEGNEYIVDYVN